MGKLYWLYRQINLLSLDITAGVVICALFFAGIFQVHIRPQGLISLGLTVWIIYTADHLLDARKIKYIAATERHRFHQNNFTPLAILLGAGILINLILVLFIREEVFQWGLFLISAVLLYLLLQKYLKFFKELFAALLYSSGVMLPSLAVASLPINQGEITIMIQFFLTAWFNLVLFSWFDEERDIQDKHHSFVTTIGKEATRKILFGIFFMNMLLTFYQVFYLELRFVPLCILTTMNIALLIILLNKNWFGVKDRFRLLGDAVFLFPIFYLL